MFKSEFHYYQIKSSHKAKQFLFHMKASNILSLAAKCDDKTLTILEWELSKRLYSKYDSIFPQIHLHPRSSLTGSLRFQYLTNYLYQCQFLQPKLSFLKPYKKKKFQNWLQFHTNDPILLHSLDLLLIFYCQGFLKLIYPPSITEDISNNY